MKKIWQKGSFTVEAAIWVPVMVFLIVGTMKIAIDFYEDSINRQSYEGLLKLDIVQEFYNYQIVGELGEEILDD